jgi:hypothetical protein
MQIQFDDIGSSERLLRQIGEEEFVDDARTRDANPALLFASWMGRYYHAAKRALEPYRVYWLLGASVQKSRRFHQPNFPFFSLSPVKYMELLGKLSPTLAGFGTDIPSSQHRGDRRWVIQEKRLFRLVVIWLG